MRLRHIEIFEAIRRTGSLTEAAAALHISQPAASKLLAHAEAQLGFNLFERVKGRLVATREAEILTPEVARLNQDLNSVRRLAASLRDRPNGHLRLGCAPALGLGLLPGVVRASRDAQPGITFDIHTHHSAELVQGLLTRELDLAITFDTNDYPGLTRMGLGHTELVHLSRKPGAGPLRLSELSDMAGDTLIVLDAGDASGALLQMTLDAQGLDPQVAIQVQTHYVACALVDAGCGDAIVDAITAQAMLRPGMSLRRLDPPLRVPISIMVRNQDPLSALHRDLIERLKAGCEARQAALDAPPA
ncbi:LysR family transcriptional regulator [Achromobacter denitrificans]|jgi:DNA-binding transcriptional LysR family regulator|uniref:LysR family transcriptional regulator n=1 Tax=Achromobacter denitrificans TaxID=32002 RepID=A0A427WYV1_ACHDE|nr:MULTISPECIES: LysR substrate-binding domain-containing protein [Achromobacter]ASC63838.1 LysR family transcriptional regulator [Achromobacter denitrificans]MBV2160402.1 LysR family transcriptional regulator [Achromobacter denitrificans]MDF3852144.1 LysR substrate-binding domain-containing protein [Achromobacter denitrificans]MDF3943394.1 LysR substrate-binding domain-containing protein [Achromobacter denitrificans]MDX3879401.1 LysR substrate-binding domain-containing protein [Achromobacter 